MCTMSAKVLDHFKSFNHYFTPFSKLETSFQTEEDLSQEQSRIQSLEDQVSNLQEQLDVLQNRGKFLEQIFLTLKKGNSSSQSAFICYWLKPPEGLLV